MIQSVTFIELWILRQVKRMWSPLDNHAFRRKIRNVFRLLLQTDDEDKTISAMSYASEKSPAGNIMWDFFWEDMRSRANAPPTPFQCGVNNTEASTKLSQCWLTTMWVCYAITEAYESKGSSGRAIVARRDKHFPVYHVEV